MNVGLDWENSVTDIMQRLPKSQGVLQTSTGVVVRNECTDSEDMLWMSYGLQISWKASIGLLISSDIIDLCLMLAFPLFVRLKMTLRALPHRCSVRISSFNLGSCHRGKVGVLRSDRKAFRQVSEFDQALIIHWKYRFLSDDDRLGMRSGRACSHSVTRGKQKAVLQGIRKASNYLKDESTD